MMDEPETQQCTQRTYHEPNDNDEIGFLLIEGYLEYPIKKGVTILGRDKNKCDIVIEDETISKVHAVIRIKKASEFFLIDMNSTNGTKCKSKALKPQFPTQFHYDDKLEFGSVFALLRRGSAAGAVADEHSLPMTQLVETPERASPLSRTSHLIVPESPDVSDKENSFLVPPCPQTKMKHASGQNNNITINKENTIVNENSIESIFWKASSRSPSLKFELNESTSTINDSFDNNTKDSLMENTEITINEMETQIPEGRAASDTTAIHNMQTQLPFPDLVVDKIHSMDTQLPDELQNRCLEEIEVENTKMKLSKTCTTESIVHINSSQNLTIYEAETQAFPSEGHYETTDKDKVDTESKPREVHVSESDEEIICEEFDTEDFEVPNSQALFSADQFIMARKSPVALKTMEDESKNCQIEHDKKQDYVKSINEVIANDDDSTDCEDEEVKKADVTENITNLAMSNMNITDTHSNFNVMGAMVNSITECDGENKVQSSGTPNIDIDNVYDMPTQIINEPSEDISDELTQLLVPMNEDKPTQILILDTQKTKTLAQEDIPVNDDIPTQPTVKKVVVTLNDDSPKITVAQRKEVDSPFKVPAQALKGKGNKQLCNIKSPIKANATISGVPSPGEKNYYTATQDIANDLSSQKDLKSSNHYECTQDVYNDLQSQGEEIVPSSQEDVTVGERFKGLVKSISPTIPCRDSSSETDYKESDKSVSDLTSQQVRDVIGIQQIVNASDVEDTPRKEFDFDDLPLSEEITQRKSSKRVRNTISSSSSEAENTEQENSESDTPIVMCKKKRVNKAKVNLAARLNPQALPTRMSARNRKPTEKIKDLIASKESDDNIEVEIIQENIAKLKGSKIVTLSEGGTTNTAISHSFRGHKNAKDAMSVTHRIAKKSSTRSKDMSECNSINVISTVTGNTVNSISDVQKFKRNPQRSKGKRELNKDAICTDSESENQPAIKRRRHQAVDKTVDIHKTRTDKTSVDRKKEDGRKSSSNEDVQVRSVNNKISNKYSAADKDKRQSLRIASPSLRRSHRQQKISVGYESPSTPTLTKVRELSGKESVLTRVDVSRDYSVSDKSDGSGTDSVAGRARKRARPATLISRPCTPTHACRILYTAYDDIDNRNILKQLGAETVDEVCSCSVVVTKRVKRTIKFLCAVSLGRPVVGDAWVKACRVAGRLVDPWCHVLVDAESERRFEFRLATALRGQRNFLAGYRLSSTKRALPPPHEMKVLVECSGGVWGEAGDGVWVVVSCAEDKSSWAGLRRRGAVVVSNEFILSGVLQQRADVDTHRLT